ncbi:MAG TPA: hypothetical protein VGB75_02905 [Jatrophihabitans sp.]|jgi:hypothetical protein|uniref:hypothetical protein n=1 Tax=Jatrophihabitans sp. TaxID=1932789 RepID=UPI002F0DE59F
MAAMVQVDDQTYRSLEFAARIGNISTGAVVAKLVAAASLPEPAKAAADVSGASVPVFVTYEGHRTDAAYDRQTKRIDVTSGPLAGRSFKTPTGAARAIVGHYKPSISPNRNGWSFWTINDGTGRLLQEIRYS